MEEQAAVLESLYEKAKEYANTNIELARLKTAGRISDLVSTLVPRLLVLLLLLIFLFIANIALSLWLGDVLGRSYYGFLVVSAFYLVLALAVHFFLSAALKRSIANKLVQRLLN